jgi:hypothetical protein
MQYLLFQWPDGTIEAVMTMSIAENSIQQFVDARQDAGWLPTAGLVTLDRASASREIFFTRATHSSNVSD